MQTETSSSALYDVKLPSDLDYIPPLRQFISEIAKIEGFPKKFCFRTEILVDELCSNAIIHGSQDIQSRVALIAEFVKDELRLSVQDQGGSQPNVDNLKRAVSSVKPASPSKLGKGMVIVQMLSNELKLKLDDNGKTEVHVVRRRDMDDSPAFRETPIPDRDQ